MSTGRVTYKCERCGVEVETSSKFEKPAHSQCRKHNNGPHKWKVIKRSQYEERMIIVAASQPTRAKYTCSLCGRSIDRSTNLGKPEPGRCPKNKQGQGPHRWTLIKKY